MVQYLSLNLYGVSNMTTKLNQKSVNDIAEYVRPAAKPFFNLAEKVACLKFKDSWNKRNTKNVPVLLLALEVNYKWFHSDVFIIKTEELEQKLARLGFTKVTPKTEMTNVLQAFCLIMHNTEYNVAIHLVDSKYMPILIQSLNIVKGTTSNYHMDVAIFISAVTELTKQLK